MSLADSGGRFATLLQCFGRWTGYLTPWLVGCLFASVGLCAEFLLNDYAGRRLPTEGPVAHITLKDPDGVTVDARGSIWYSAAGRIYRVDSNGTAKAVLSPYGYAFSRSIVPLPNGSVVLEESNGPLLLDDRDVVSPLRAGDVWTLPAGVGQYVSNGSLGFDSNGRFFFTDYHVVRRVDLGGDVSPFAGVGLNNHFGDGNLAVDAGLINPQGIAWDPTGNLFIAETGSCRVRKVDRNGIISTLAGVGCATTPATEGGRGLGLIVSIAYHRATNSIIAVDRSLNVLWRIQQDGTYTRIAGTGRTGPVANTRATETPLLEPVAVTVASDDSIWVAERVGRRLRRIAPDGSITTPIGMPTFGGEGVAATQAALRSPLAGAVGPDGSYYFSDSGNHRIRRILPSGTIHTVCGMAEAGYLGDGGPANRARLYRPGALAIAGDGTLYFADQEQKVIRKVNPQGTISTVVGLDRNGRPVFGNQWGVRAMALYRGGLLIAAGFSRILHVALGANSEGSITTFAGGGVSGSAGDGGPVSLARFTRTNGIAVDQTGRIYISDARQLRAVDTGGTISAFGTASSTDEFGSIAASSDGSVYVVAGSKVLQFAPLNPAAVVVAGTGVSGYDSVPRTANTTRLSAQLSVASGPDGVLFVHDAEEDFIRRLTPLTPQRLEIVSGNNQTAAVGAALAPLVVRLTGTASVPIKDRVNFRVVAGGARLSLASSLTDDSGRAGVAAVLVSADQVVVEASASGVPAVRFDLRGLSPAAPVGANVAPTGPKYILEPYAGHAPLQTDLSASDIPLVRTTGLLMRRNGDLLISDDTRIWRVDSSGRASPFAGNGDAGVSRLENVDARSVPIGTPGQLAEDEAGNIIFSDGLRVRMVTPGGKIRTVAGRLFGGTEGVEASAGDARLATLASLSRGGDGRIYVSQSNPPVIKVITADGVVRRVVGNGQSPTTDPQYEGQLAENIALYWVSHILVDPTGRLFFVTPATVRIDEVWFSGQAIYQLGEDGRVKLIAGGIRTSSGKDGLPARDALITDIQGLAWHADSLCFSTEAQVRCIDSAGVLRTIVGSASLETPNLADGPALLATFGLIGPITASHETIFFVDMLGWTVRRYTNGNLTTVAGSLFDPQHQATRESAWFRATDFSIDKADNLYLADYPHFAVRKIDPGSGIVSTVAGTGRPGDQRTPAPALRFPITPGGVAAADDGFFVMDFSGSESILYRVSDGTIDEWIPAKRGTVFGEGSDVHNTYFASTFNSMAAKSDGSLLLADTRARAVSVSPSGRVQHLMGTGRLGFHIGATAIDSSIGVTLLAVGPGDTVYASDGVRIVRLSSDGRLSVIAGNGMPYTASPDGSLATTVPLNIGAMTVDSRGRIFIYDSHETLVRMIDEHGLIWTIAAGVRRAGTGSDLQFPLRLAVDSLARIYVLDNWRKIWRLTRVND